jgi:hypothetical protein
MLYGKNKIKFMKIYGAVLPGRFNGKEQGREDVRGSNGG